MQKPKSLSQAVYITICWFDTFEQPVSAEEIHRYLFFHKANLTEIKTCLKKDKRISKSFGFYFLRGKNALVVKRCQRQYQAGKLWRKIFAKSFLFNWTPFLSTVAVGNTLAMGWPKKNSDIDLLIIAKKNRLFTTRLFLTFFSHIFRLRRHSKKVAGRFCLSFFLTRPDLKLKKLLIKPYDPYLAFWLATLTPVYGENMKKIIEDNKWISSYFPNFNPKLKSKRPKQNNWLEKILNGKLGNLLEKILKRWQVKRAQKKQSSNEEESAVVISETILKFHESDRRREFLNAWEKKVKA